MCVLSLPYTRPTQLLKHLDSLISEEVERSWKPPEGQEGSQVLGSANQLFLKIRASLNRCVKLVSRGNTLLRLSGAFKVSGGWLLRGQRTWGMGRLAACVVVQVVMVWLYHHAWCACP